MRDKRQVRGPNCSIAKSSPPIGRLTGRTAGAIWRMKFWCSNPRLAGRRIMNIHKEVSMLRLVTRLLLPCLVLLAASALPVWAGQTPLPWVARDGLSAADYQKAFDDFGKDGFELA
ncbi:hypothetical protein, partial [Roseiarcus sp.]|uniref:hypothetical protein n=1 Tax=Roseiarcus sp. TaxID=1969460 RepID=UPI003C74288E